MWFRKRFDFVGLLAEQARMSEAGLELLCAYMRQPSTALTEALDETEKKADALRRALIEALNRTFVTPIDREDIFALSGALDDMVDYANSTVEEMTLFQAQTNARLQAMSEAIYEGARHITRGVEGLRDLPNNVSDHIIQAKKSENRVEHLYREGLAELFKTQDVVSIIKLREIYRHLSNAADRADEAADILSDILVKNT